MDNIVNFTINLNGTAYTGVAQLDEALGNVLVDVQKTQSWFGSLVFRLQKNGVVKTGTGRRER